MRPSRLSGAVAGLILLAVGLSVAGASENIEQLLSDLQIVPLAGDPAPSFSLETLDGRRLSLADLRGRPALLYFWATW